MANGNQSNIGFQAGGQVGQNIGDVLLKLLQSPQARQGFQAIQLGLGAVRQATPGGAALPQVAIEEGNKVLKAFFKEQAEQLVQQPGGAEALSKTVGAQANGGTPTGALAPTSALGPVSTTAPQPSAQAQPSAVTPPVAPGAGGPAVQQGQNLLNQILAGVGLDPSQGLIRQPGVSPEGATTPGSALFGLLRETAASQLQRQQAQALTPGAVTAEATQKAQIDIFKEQFKQDRLDEREVLKAQLKAAGDNDVTVGLKTLTQDVINLTDARNAIFGKGRVGGKISGLFAASPLGFQRDKRAQAESFAESLLFSFGEHIIGQKGRAFVKDEQERVKKNVIGAILNESDKVFKARMNAIIKQANSRLPQGATTIPDIDTLTRRTVNVRETTAQEFKPGQKGTALGIGFTVE